jgi:hypothetical protein
LTKITPSFFIATCRNPQQVGLLTRLSPRQLFERAKISCKKTQKTNPKFDKEMVKKKTEEINDILSFKNKAGIENGEIIVLFLDECHLLHGALTGYVWGQSKIRIEVPITNERDRQTYFVALNYQSKEFHVHIHLTMENQQLNS